MINNPILNFIGRIAPALLHWHFSNLTGWMFAAVWIRSERRHRFMWVNEEQYYGGKYQSIA